MGKGFPKGFGKGFGKGGFGKGLGWLGGLREEVLDVREFFFFFFKWRLFGFVVFLVAFIVFLFVCCMSEGKMGKVLFEMGGCL